MAVKVTTSLVFVPQCGELGRAFSDISNPGLILASMIGIYNYETRIIAQCAIPN